MQQAQVRVEELKALTSMIPLLASNDERTRAVGKQLLQAVLGTSSDSVYRNLQVVQSESVSISPGRPNHTAAPSPRLVSQAAPRSRSSVIDAFALIALAPDATPAQRVEATREIGRIATAPSATREVRERAVNVAEEIAVSEAPEEVRQTAVAVIEQIRAVGPGGEEILYTVSESGWVTWVSGWEEEKIIRVPIPQLTGIRGAPATGTVPFYAGAAQDLQAAWAEIEQAGLLGLVRTWSGSYVPRQMRHTGQLSAHALGIAFDINVEWNRPGQPPPAIGEEGSLRELVPIFEKHNFRWGGHFRVPDGNHFYWTGGAKQ